MWMDLASKYLNITIKCISLSKASDKVACLPNNTKGTKSVCLSVCLFVCLSRRVMGAIAHACRSDGLWQGAETCTPPRSRCGTVLPAVLIYVGRRVGTWHALKKRQFPRCLNMGNLHSKREETANCSRHECASELIFREQSIGSTRGQHWRVGNRMDWRTECRTGGGPVHVL